MQLRPYQQELKDGIYQAWDDGAKNVMGVSATGSGKTVLFSDILNDHNGMSCTIAHRQELIGQISRALNRNEVPHQIITSDSRFINYITSVHRRETGFTTYASNADCVVAGVDTLIRRKSTLSTMFRQVTKWVIDEGHHVTEVNKWGKACEMFPNALGLAVTATPTRSDRIGLGRGQGGLMDAMVVGPSMRFLIENGYLTDYRVFAPPTDDLHIENVEVGSTGDFKQKQLKKAVQESHLVGDIVQHYKRIAMGKLGVTFCTDVETATETAQQFNDAGVPAMVVSAKTPDRDRVDILEKFARREILQLVNVDLFGEGFDLPAIEVVSMARPTASYSLYVQQFGRALRPLEGKPYAIIIDHVGNVMRHGLPDKERMWSLDAPDSTPRAIDPDDDIPLRYCVECTQPYERFHKTCPWCGHYPVPAERGKPEYVDGDLTELTPEILAAMRSDIAKIDEAPDALAHRMKMAGAPEVAWRSASKKSRRRQDVQLSLRASVEWFAGLLRQQGRNDSEIYRMFYLLFGTDVLTAQTLSPKEALVLATKINDYITETYQLIKGREQ
jgi:DNA repair protein RadD